MTNIYSRYTTKESWCSSSITFIDLPTPQTFATAGCLTGRVFSWIGWTVKVQTHDSKTFYLYVTYAWKQSLSKQTGSLSQKTVSLLNQNFLHELDRLVKALNFEEVHKRLTEINTVIDDTPWTTPILFNLLFVRGAIAYHDMPKKISETREEIERLRKENSDANFNKLLEQIVELLNQNRPPIDPSNSRIDQLNVILAMDNLPVEIKNLIENYFLQLVLSRFMLIKREKEKIKSAAESEKKAYQQIVQGNIDQGLAFLDSAKSTFQAFPEEVARLQKVQELMHKHKAWLNEINALRQQAKKLQKTLLIRYNEHKEQFAKDCHIALLLKSEIERSEGTAEIEPETFSEIEANFADIHYVYEDILSKRQSLKRRLVHFQNLDRNFQGYIDAISHHNRYLKALREGKLDEAIQFLTLVKDNIPHAKEGYTKTLTHMQTVRDSKPIDVNLEKWRTCLRTHQNPTLISIQANLLKLIDEGTFDSRTYAEVSMTLFRNQKKIISSPIDTIYSLPDAHPAKRKATFAQFLEQYLQNLFTELHVVHP